MGSVRHHGRAGRCRATDEAEGKHTWQNSSRYWPRCSPWWCSRRLRRASSRAGPYRRSCSSSWREPSWDRTAWASSMRRQGLRCSAGWAWASCSSSPATSSTCASSRDARGATGPSAGPSAWRLPAPPPSRLASGCPPPARRRSPSPSRRRPTAPSSPSCVTASSRARRWGRSSSPMAPWASCCPWWPCPSCSRPSAPWAQT